MGGLSRNGRYYWSLMVLLLLCMQGEWNAAAEWTGGILSTWVDAGEDEMSDEVDEDWPWTTFKTTSWLNACHQFTGELMQHYAVYGSPQKSFNRQGCARGLFSWDRGETETLKPIQAEARPRPRPSELETETRPKRTNSEARWSRGTAAPRDGLETEASRPRPHPCQSVSQKVSQLVSILVYSRN